MLGFTNEKHLNEVIVSEYMRSQLFPLFVVLKILPKFSDTKPVLSDGNIIASKTDIAGKVCEVQFSPEFVVFKITAGNPPQI